MSDYPLTHDDMKELAKELDRPLFTLEITQEDPFTAGQPARLARAEWFADLWQRFKFQPGAHLRRIHYVLISQPQGTVLMPDGSPYLNVTKPCFNLLNSASRDARYLNLVRPEWLVDRRNDEPVIYLPNNASDAELNIAGGLLENELRGFEVPQLELDSADDPAALSRGDLVRENHHERRVAAVVRALRHQPDHRLR